MNKQTIKTASFDGTCCKIRDGVVTKIWKQVHDGPDSRWTSVKSGNILARVQTLPVGHKHHRQFATHVEVNVGAPAPPELMAVYQEGNP